MSSKKFLQLFKNYIWTQKCVPLHMRVISYHQSNNISTSKNGSKSVKKASTKEEKTRTGYSYITDSSCAESIAFHISHDWKDGYIFEANPGFGVLSKAILNTSPPQFRIFEKHSEFLPALQALKKDYGNLEIVEADLLSLPHIVTKSNHNASNDDLEIIFNGVQKCPWRNGVPFRVFATISSVKSIKFLRFLLIAIADQSSIFSYGRCEFFVLVNENEYQYMVPDAKPSYSSFSWPKVLYSLFFEIKCLDKFSSEILFPYPTRKNKIENEEQGFYLMKLTPNPHLLSSIVNENRLVEFYFFVRRLLVKRSHLVIPELEDWIPSCGPRLIKQGIKVFTKFGDLDPNQLVQLFNQFSSWPEYEDCTFHLSMRDFFRKKNLNPPLFADEEDHT